MSHPEFFDLHYLIAAAMDDCLAHTRRSLGPNAWYGVEPATGVDGDHIQVTHCVGLRGHDPSSLQVWGRGANVDAAIDEALEEMPTRRPKSWAKARAR